MKLPLNLYLLRAESSPAGILGTRASATPGDAGPFDDEQLDDQATWERTWLLGETPTEQALTEEREGPASLYVRSSPAATPWQVLIGGLVASFPVTNGQRNLGALLFQPIDNEMVVWSFGNAWLLVDSSHTVDRFGLKAGLNALLSSPEPAGAARPRKVGVRGLTSAIRAAVVRRSTVTTARPSSPSEMERVDQTSDAASMADLTTHHPIFDRISAGRSLRFEASASDLADLEKFAREAIRLFRRTDYTKSRDYEWIDYTVPVVDRTEVNNVLDEIYAKAVADVSYPIDVVWAETDPDTRITPSFVAFPRERTAGKLDSHRPELTWDLTRAWLQHNRALLAGRDALRTPLRFLDDRFVETRQQELWTLLVGEVAIGKNTYLMSDGEIWRTSSEHLKNIDRYVAQFVQVNPSHLPLYAAGEKEGGYNVRASAHGGHFLLDKELVQLEGQSRFEPCDLLSVDGRFMHVKRKTSSATMSHVFTQALAATELLRNEADARDAVDAVLDNALRSGRALRAMRDHVGAFAARPTGTIEIVIVGTWRGDPAIEKLPLLTRLALSSWLRSIPCGKSVSLIGTR